MNSDEAVSADRMRLRELISRLKQIEHNFGDLPVALSVCYENEDGEDAFARCLLCAVEVESVRIENRFMPSGEIKPRAVVLS